jgi:transcriptional regulator with XRE-family HTH domain
MESKQANNLGKRIKELRQKKGLSQDELARKAEVAYTTLTKIETGVIKNPSVAITIKIAKALDASIEEIVRDFNS